MTSVSVRRVDSSTDVVKRLKEAFRLHHIAFQVSLEHPDRFLCVTRAEDRSMCFRTEVEEQSVIFFLFYGNLKHYQMVIDRVMAEIEKIEKI